MQLTLDARLINSSGIGVYLQNILRSEISNVFDLKILYKKSDEAFVNQLEAIRKKEEYNADLYSIKELIQTPSKTRNSEIFWAPHYNVPLINFASKLKVVTIHDVFHLAFYHTLSTSQKLYATLMIKRAVTSSDLIFTVSETSKKEIIKYTNCDPSKIKVVYNGIDFIKFNTPALNKTEVLNRYSIHFPYILFVGNVKPHKNLKQGLLGFKEYLKANATSIIPKFVIVGKRDGFITGDTEINNLVADPLLKNHVHFTGWVNHDDLPALYQQATAFIFPSLYEGFGFPPLEAMAAGCPVISSNASCLPEIYNDAALFFNPNNPIEIGNVLGKVLMDSPLREKQVQKGFLQSKKYLWEEAIAKKLTFIKEYAAANN